MSDQGVGTGRWRLYILGGGVQFRRIQFIGSTHEVLTSCDLSALCILISTRSSHQGIQSTEVVLHDNFATAAAVLFGIYK